MATFKLVGWSNPYGRYPAPIIPVGRINERLFAIYPGGEKHEDPISEDDFYVHFSTEQLVDFRDFDHLRERLFVTDEDCVVRYAADHEKTFFAGLLIDPDFCKGYPAMRNLLQKTVDGG